MKQRLHDPQTGEEISRRGLIKRLGTAAGIAAVTPGFALGHNMGQNAPGAANGSAATVLSDPPRDFGPSAPPAPYPDADVLVVDPLFNKYHVFNTSIERLWTGGLWSEGPAWNGQGRYLVWSDLPNNRQMRWLQDDGRISIFRSPSNNGNGNSFDFQGRQITCEHLTRRVVRYEHDGSVTILADNFNGKHFNSPNDLAPHPDGSVWFTDPFFGDSLYEGVPDAPGGFGNEAGHVKQRLGQPVEIGGLKRELPANVYRIDPSGKIDMVVSESELPLPNGIAFSPDYKKVYIVSQGAITAFDVGSDNRLANKKLFADFMVDGVKCATDGFRVDVDGNLWCGSNAGPHLGYSGVTVWTPEGKLIGRIRLPEACANVAFGGPKRNRLFMAASSSLYALYVNTQGAAPG